MSIAVICEQARRAARESVRSGEWTERGLARLAGVSQPHMHNVLKGVRSLSIKLADRILYVLDIQTRDLLGEDDGALRSVPLMRDDLGACSEFRPYLTAGEVSVPAQFANPAGCPVAAVVGQDYQLPAGIEPGYMVIIQQTAGFCSMSDTRAVYLVLTTRGACLRHVQVATDGRIYIASEPSVRTPSEWAPVPADSIRGRAVWIARGAARVVVCATDTDITRGAPFSRPNCSR